MNKNQVYLGGWYLLNEYKRGLSDLGGCMRPTEYLVLVVSVPKKCQTEQERKWCNKNHVFFNAC